jgi:hypothetical protein
VVLNLAAFFCSAILISEWLSRKFHISAYFLFLFVLSAPAAYFAFTVYSDLLFMLLLWILLWVAFMAPQRRGYKILIAQSSLLFVLPWIRLTGYALVSWLLARRAVALALWLGFNRMIAGNALYFLHAQELFAMPQGNFFQGLADSLRHLASDWQVRPATNWLEFGFLPLFYLGALTPVLCLPLLVTAESGPRRASYFSRAAFCAITIGQFSLQIYFARIFHAGGWAF